MTKQGIIIPNGQQPTPDYNLSYEKKEFEENTFFEVTAKKPGSMDPPELVAHFFEEQAAKMCCVRYNLHEQLMKICLLAGHYRAREHTYISQRNIGANAAKKEAGDMLDRALFDIKKL